MACVVVIVMSLFQAVRLGLGGHDALYLLVIQRRPRTSIYVRCDDTYDTYSPFDQFSRLASRSA